MGCNTTAEGFLSRNQVMDLAIDPLTEMLCTEPEKRKEMLRTLAFLQSQKINGNEADVEKIKNTF